MKIVFESAAIWFGLILAGCSNTSSQRTLVDTTQVDIAIKAYIAATQQLALYDGFYTDTVSNPEAVVPSVTSAVMHPLASPSQAVITGTIAPVRNAYATAEYAENGSHYLFPDNGQGRIFNLMSGIRFRFSG